MIDVAKRKADECKIKNINYAQTTIFDEGFKKESLNVILAFNILHLLEKRHEALKRINELLTPGGLFISTTACLGEKSSFILGAFLFLLSRIGLIPYLKLFKISELENLVIQGNFKIVEAKILKSFPSNHFIAAKKT